MFAYLDGKLDDSLSQSAIALADIEELKGSFFFPFNLAIAATFTVRLATATEMHSHVNFIYVLGAF